NGDKFGFWKNQVNIRGLAGGLVTDGVSVHHVLNQPAEEARCRAGAPSERGAHRRTGARGVLIRAFSAAPPRRLAFPMAPATKRSAAVAAGLRSAEAGGGPAPRARVGAAPAASAACTPPVGAR